MEDKKLNVVISSPLFTLSGYGKHSMDIVKSLIKIYDDTWDIKLISNKWGACTMVEDVDEDLAKRVLLAPMKEQPDIWIQISIPNEFHPVGKFNIGITAGIESTACSGPWLEGVNKMDYILVPSEHSKHVFETTIYDKFDKAGTNLGKLKLETPIDVIFEGVDLKYFHKTKDLDVKIDTYINDNVKEEFNFLLVSQWGTGEIFHDRKDVAGAIFSFFKAFKDKENSPGLILKVNGAAYSEVDKARILEKIETVRQFTEFDNVTLPNVYVVYGQLSELELNSLYNHPKVKCMLSLTKGEGYSRTFPEYLVSGKPIITTKFSGHLDFLDDKLAVLIPGELKKLHPSVVWKNILIPEAKWLYVDYDTVSIYLKDMYVDYNAYLKKSNVLGNRIADKLNFDKMTEKLKELIDTYLDKNYIKPIEYADIVLPNLDDIKELK